VSAEIANRVARHVMVAHRRGGQAQFIEQPMPVDAGDDRLSSAMEWASPICRSRWTSWRAGRRPKDIHAAVQQPDRNSLTPWLNNQRVAFARGL
jgi:hypothetical protein